MMSFEEDKILNKNYSLLCKYKNGNEVDEKLLDFSTLKTIGKLTWIFE